MKPHHAILSASVAGLLILACAIGPETREQVAAIDRERAGLSASLAVADDPALRAEMERMLRELHDLRRASIAADAGEQTRITIDALEALLGVLGLGGISAVLARIGKSRAQKEIDEMWDRIAQAQAVIAALQERVDRPAVRPQSGGESEIYRGP